MAELATTHSAVSVRGGHNRARALIALTVAGVLIGWSPILVRLSPVGPVTTAFWRVSLACFPILIVLGYKAREAHIGKLPRRLDEHITAAIPGVFLAADLAAWQVSLHMTSVANSTLLANMTPIFATLGGWLIWRHSVSHVFLAGLAISIIGIIVLRGGPAAIGAGNIRGDAMALLAAVFYAGYILLVARARQVFPATVIMLWSTASAAVCTLPLAIRFDAGLFPSTIADLGSYLRWPGSFMRAD